MEEQRAARIADQQGWFELQATSMQPHHLGHAAALASSKRGLESRRVLDLADPDEFLKGLRNILTGISNEAALHDWENDHPILKAALGGDGKILFDLKIEFSDGMETDDPLSLEVQIVLTRLPQVIDALDRALFANTPAVTQ